MCSIRLICSEQYVLTYSEAACRKSKTLSDRLDAIGFDGNPKAEWELPVPPINGRILDLAMTWCEHYKNEQQEVMGGLEDYKLPAFDTQLLKIETYELLCLTLTANYLKIPGLLDSTCKSIGKLIKGKPNRQVQKIFGLDGKVAKDDQDINVIADAVEMAHCYLHGIPIKSDWDSSCQCPYSSIPSTSGIKKDD